MDEKVRGGDLRLFLLVNLVGFEPRGTLSHIGCEHHRKASHWGGYKASGLIFNTKII